MLALGSGGKHKGSFAGLSLLTFLCMAWFLRGHRLVPVHGLGVGISLWQSTGLVSTLQALHRA